MVCGRAILKLMPCSMGNHRRFWRTDVPRSFERANPDVSLLKHKRPTPSGYEMHSLCWQALQKPTKALVRMWIGVLMKEKGRDGQRQTMILLMWETSRSVVSWVRTMSIWLQM